MGNTTEKNKTYNTLEEIINKQAIKENIGETTIYANQEYKVQIEKIKKADCKAKKKRSKQAKKHTSTTN